MSVGVDFDFARWIAERRGTVERQAREGVAYAFVGERKFRGTLGSTRPVMIALEATTRMWRDKSREELLANTKVSETQYPRVYNAARAAGAALRVKVPMMFVTPTSNIGIQVLGMEDAPYLVVNATLAEHLDDSSLIAAIGHELGHVQNGHVLYATALHYLNHSAAFFVRWAVQPAIVTLQAWARRAEVTCDRAALLAVKDLDKALIGLASVAVGPDKIAGFDAAAFVRDLPDPAVAHKGVGKFAELFRSNPYIAKRAKALRLFADSAYYAISQGLDATGKTSSIDVDQKVADLISVF
jgi:Zn-dependent protease with chaperone function